MNEFAIHYHLQDGVHEMNAKTLNVCEAKVLMIIDRILSTLELNFDTELIVRTEGGIRDILKLKPKTTFDRFVCNILLPILSTMVYDLLKDAIRNPSQLYISQEQIEQISEALNAKMQTVPTPETSVEISAAQERQNSHAWIFLLSEARSRADRSGHHPAIQLVHQHRRWHSGG